MEKKKEYSEMYYFGYFKKLYESWEESTNKMMDVWMSNPLMERAVEKSSEFKNYIHGFIEESLEKRYMPHKQDMDRLIETIDSLETKIAELEEKIEDLQKRPLKSVPRKKSGTAPKKQAKKIQVKKNKEKKQ